jgi:predicted transcriptional regulator
LEKAFVKDIIDALPEPKPAYNTVSTIVRILQDKGFVTHKAYGKTHEYYPVIDKNEYSNFFLKSVMSRYFGGSFQQMVSFFVKENNVDLQEFDELMKHVEDDVKNDPQDSARP